MIGARDVSRSERGMFCMILIALATILVFFGKLDGAQWVSFCSSTMTALIASKTYSKYIQSKTGTPPPLAQG